MHVFLGGAARCRLEEDEVAGDNVRAVSSLRIVMGLAVALVVFIAVVESVFTNELAAAASATGVVGVGINDGRGGMSDDDRKRKLLRVRNHFICQIKEKRERMCFEFIITVSLQTSRGYKFEIKARNLGIEHSGI